MSTSTTDSAMMEQTQAEPRPYMSTDEAAAYHHRDERTVQSWAAEGLIPGAHKIGRGQNARYIFPRASIEQFTPPPRGRRPKTTQQEQPQP